MGDYIKIRIPGESMWALSINATTAKVANIPFSTNDFTLGDLVEIDENNEVIGVLERGAYNLTCFYEYEDELIQTQWVQLKEHLQSFDIKVEGGVKGLCMISVPKDIEEERLLNEIFPSSPVSIRVSKDEPEEGQND